MYWNYKDGNFVSDENMININMRCIEMFKAYPKNYGGVGLTLTWDVLKWWYLNIIISTTIEININMRCIEMIKKIIILKDCIGLTLTWDVLKFKRNLSTI